MGNNCCNAPIENQKSDFDSELAPVHKPSNDIADTQSEKQLIKKKKIKLGPKSIPSGKKFPLSSVEKPNDESNRMSTTLIKHLLKPMRSEVEGLVSMDLI